MSAGPAVDEAPSCVAGPTARAASLALVSALAGLMVLVVGYFGPLLGMRVPAATLALLAVGAIVVERTGARAPESISLVGLVVLFSTNRVHAIYHLAVVVALFFVRRSVGKMALVLVALAIALPKYLFTAHYRSPGLYNWINEPSVGLILLVSLCWMRDLRDGRLPAGAGGASLSRWAALYLVPGHAVNPMLFTATDVFGARRLDARLVVTSATLIAGKALAHTALGQLLPQVTYAGLTSARAAALPWAGLWTIVLVSYVDLALLLSGTADVAILLARLYGLPLRSPFRWALLAWNPVELWRRWGIYNRKVLLKLVYFPLGGRRRRSLNVLLTFLASAWVLHSGWFGSKYWVVGLPGWRDQAVYFLLQGTIVCVWLAVSARFEGRDGSGDVPASPWSPGRVMGTVVTQAAAAWAHVIVLAQDLPFLERFELMARCLGYDAR